MKLKTSRLILRHNVKGDLQNLHTLLSDKDNMYFLDDISTTTIEQTSENLNLAMSNSDGQYFCIEDRVTGEYIGQIGYTYSDINPLGKVAHLGYFILPKFHSKGYTTEAAKEALSYAFTSDNCIRITTGCYSDNLPSRRVMEKVGFRLEGTMLNAQYHDGVMKDRLGYAMTKSEWEVLREIEYYNSLPCTFDGFIDVPTLSDGEIYLVCTKKTPAIPEKKYVPVYDFIICKEGERIGFLNLRVGYTAGLYFGGQIGYGVDERYRGHSYATKACQLVAPVAKAHNMTHLLITNERDNIPSKRACEKLSARFLRVARLPEWSELYQEGQRYLNIFEWKVE